MSLRSLLKCWLGSALAVCDFLGQILDVDVLVEVALAWKDPFSATRDRVQRLEFFPDIVGEVNLMVHSIFGILHIEDASVEVHLRPPSCEQFIGDPDASGQRDQ